MKITYIKVENFKSIREMVIEEVDNVLILVGKNNTGKTVVLDAILTASGERNIEECDYIDRSKPIVIGLKVEFSETDLESFHKRGIISKYKKFDLWKKEFRSEERRVGKEC